MSRSGVSVDSECIVKYDELKLGKKLKYVIYGLNDKKTQVIILKDSSADALGETPESAYEAFVANLPENDCRWAVYDFDFEKEAGEGKRSKICFFSWSPDDAPVRSKMVYASSKDGLRRALAGVAVEIQGTDFSEVAYETVLEKCIKGR